MRDWIINILAVWFALALAIVVGTVLGGGARHQPATPKCVDATADDVWCRGDTSSHPRGESWDQENLHRNETICPNSTYYAPGGVLTECP